MSETTNEVTTVERGARKVREGKEERRRLIPCWRACGSGDSDNVRCAYYPQQSHPGQCAHPLAARF